MCICGKTSVLTIAFPLLLMGCVATLKAPELNLDHPANPSARQAPPPAPSSTLQSYRDWFGEDNETAARPAPDEEKGEHDGHKH
jgi:hypothetical protein